MTIKSRLSRQFKRVVRRIAEDVAESTQKPRDIDFVLAAALREPGVLSRLRFPVEYAQLLREAMGPCHHQLLEVKQLDHSADPANDRFDMVCHALRTGLPPLHYGVAHDIAMIADGNRNLSQPLEFDRWAGDLGLHFSESSSFGEKGRVLFNIVRIMRPRKSLELGTAFGMSALFILAALKAFVPCGSLATVEGTESIYSLSSSMLKSHYGEMVSCTLGYIRVVLAEIARSLGQIDFLFHDSTHSGDAYTKDFSEVVDFLAPGGIVLFDDIRWQDSRMKVSSSTYEGWQAVCAHTRVRRAVEVDESLGLLLMR